MGYDYRKLRGRIREVYGTQAAFAKAIGTSNTSLSLKLNNHTDFKQCEIKKAIGVLGIDDEAITEYFFEHDFS